MKPFRILAPAVLLSAALCIVVATGAGNRRLSAEGYELRARVPMVAADSAVFVVAPPTVSRSATASATESLSPTAIVVSGRCSVRNVGKFVDSTGTLFVFGEFVNHTPSVIGPNQHNDGAEVTLVLRSSTGDVVASETGFLLPVLIDPGADAIFQVALDNPLAYASLNVEVSACDSASFDILQIGLTPRLTTLTSAVTTGADLTVVGTARNDDNKTISAVAAIVAIYGSDGNVLRVANRLVTPVTLAVGAIGSFSVTMPESGGLSPASYRIWYGP